MKKIISILLAVMMLCSTAVTVLAADTPSKEYPQKFWDVPKDHWAFSYIAELEDRGVIAGYEDGSFKPNKTVTRAEWAKIMVLAAGLPLVYVFDRGDHYIDAYFYDTLDHWARPYINTAKDYLAGYTDDTFRPDQAAVREDVTVSMVKLKGYDVSEVDYSYLSRFSDVNSISNSLKAYVSAAVEKDLIDGFEDGTFRGQDTLTRAEAATLLWRAFQHGNDNKVVEPTETITETPKLAEQPKATEKLKATLKPTPEPEPTEEPTPEPTEKPYKVDTLIKANISDSDNFYSYTYSDDSVYYIENNKIMKVNVASKDKEEILNIEDLTIDTDEYTLSDFDVYSICYDKYKDRLLVQGLYKTVNSANDLSIEYLYEIKDNTVNLITDNFSCYENYIIGVLNCGDYVTTKSIIDCDDFSVKERSFGNSVEEIDDKIYYLNAPRAGYGTTYYQLFSYDYVDTDEIWSKTLQTLAFGLNGENYMIVDNDDIIFYNLKGKEIKRITKADCDVIDKTALNYNNTSRKLLFFDDDIVFYDTSAKAFRMISKNK